MKYVTLPLRSSSTACFEMPKLGLTVSEVAGGTPSGLTIRELAKHLGAQIGFLSVLHTWGQNLPLQPSCPLRDRARRLTVGSPRYAFFLPVKVLSRVFRGKFIAGLKRASRDRKLSFPGSLRHLAEEKAFMFMQSLFRGDRDDEVGTRD